MLNLTLRAYSLRTNSISNFSTRSISGTHKTQETLLKQKSLTQQPVRYFQLQKSLYRIPALKKALRKIGMGPKPPKIPTKDEFETMPDQEKYKWALVGRKMVSPWDENKTLSMSLFEQLVSNNYLEAKYSYATMIMTGQIRGDIAEGIRLWEDCSRSGHSWAKSNLAQTLSEGRLVRQDLERAIRLFTEAWEAKTPLSEGHAHTSALNLYNLYLKVGRESDAVRWLTKAADEADDTLAQYQLGNAYSFGKLGLPQDLEKAVWYTRRAADKGLVLAQHNIGCIYYEGGMGVEKDYEAAAYYFTKAHYQDFYWSTLNLASMFAAGRGVPQNTVTAQILLKDVLTSGSSDDQKKAAEEVLENVKKVERGEALMEEDLRIRSNPPTQPL